MARKPRITGSQAYRGGIMQPSALNMSADRSYAAGFAWFSFLLLLEEACQTYRARVAEGG